MRQESLTEPGTHQLCWLASSSRDLTVSAFPGLELQSFTTIIKPGLLRWGLEIQTQSLMFEQQVLYWLNHLSNPSFLRICNRVSHTPSWLQIHCVAKDGLELIDPPASASWLLELCIPTIPSNIRDYKMERTQVLVKKYEKTCQ